MKKIIRKIIKIGTTVPVMACFLLFSCKETEEETFAPVLEASVDQLTFVAAGESKTVRLNSNRTVTVSSAADWCKVELTEGFDNLKVTVLPTAVIAKQRETAVTVSASDNEDVKLTVRQNGVEPVISITEALIALASSDTEFSLEIVTNLSALAFDLPVWISEKAGNTTVVGKSTYYFIAEAGVPGEVRKGMITVKSAVPDISKQESIPVEQGSEDELLPHINKSTETIVEAETSLEGYAEEYQDYWDFFNIMFDDNLFITFFGEASYKVKVVDAGNYDFTFHVANWGAPRDLELLVDGVACGAVSVPTSDGTNASKVTISNVALTTGIHVLKVRFGGNFDKIIVK